MSKRARAHEEEERLERPTKRHKADSETMKVTKKDSGVKDINNDPSVLNKILRSNLEELTIKGQPGHDTFSDDSFAALLEGLKKAKKLTALTLDSCGIDDAKASQVIDALKRCRHIRFVDFSGNSINEKTLDTLSTKLPSQCTIAYDYPQPALEEKAEEWDKAVPASQISKFLLDNKARLGNITKITIEGTLKRQRGNITRFCRNAPNLQSIAFIDHGLDEKASKTVEGWVKAARSGIKITFAGLERTDVLAEEIADCVRLLEEGRTAGQAAQQGDFVNKVLADRADKAKFPTTLTFDRY